MFDSSRLRDIFDCGNYLRVSDVLMWECCFLWWTVYTDHNAIYWHALLNLAGQISYSAAKTHAIDRCAAAVSYGGWNASSGDRFFLQHRRCLWAHAPFLKMLPPPPHSLLRLGTAPQNLHPEPRLPNASRDFGSWTPRQSERPETRSQVRRLDGWRHEADSVRWQRVTADVGLYVTLLRAGAEEGEVVVMETGVTACAGVGRVHASSLWLPSW